MRMSAIILVMIGFIAIIAISTPAEGSVPVDPFAPYADLLTQDQALHALVKRKFSCVSEYLSESRQDCSLLLDDPTYSKINVTIVNGIPRDVSFQIRKNSLRLGDLALLWGKPETPFLDVGATLFWPERDGMTASAFVLYIGHVDYRIPVSIVTFAFWT